MQFLIRCDLITARIGEVPLACACLGANIIKSHRRENISVTVTNVHAFCVPASGGAAELWSRSPAAPAGPEEAPEGPTHLRGPGTQLYCRGQRPQPHRRVPGDQQGPAAKGEAHQCYTKHQC